MDLRRLRTWPVLLVAAAAAASSTVWFAAEVHDLDPRVWQAIAETDAAKCLQPLFGESR